MSDIYLRKYGEASIINFVLHEVDGVDFRVDAAAASGDSTLMKDEGAEANTANLFVDEGQGYSLALTAAELAAARIVVYLVDSATKVWLDRELKIETYGNASAQHAMDFDTTVPTPTEIRQEMDTESVQLAQISGDVIAISGDVLIIDTEVGLISGDVEAILADTNEMQGKLPANKFMGSSDGADDDGTLNTISTDVGKVSGDLNVVSGDVVTIDGKIDVIDTEVGLISGDTSGLGGAAMRGTDNAALASVCTEGRLAELDAGNLPATTDRIETATGVISGDTSAISTLDTKLDDIQGAGFNSGDDSLTAIRDRGDVAWTTGAGGSAPTVVQIREEMDANSLQLARISGDVIVVSGDIVTIDGKVDTIDTEVGLISGDVANILNDTNEMQGKLPTNKFMGSSDGADDDGTLNTILDETRHVSGDLLVVSGDVVSVESKVDTIDTEVGLISGDVANLVASEGEPAQGAPPVTATINDKISHMYKFMRNKVVTTSGDIIVRNDGDSADDHKSVISGDSTTFTRGEFGTGA